MPDKLSMIPDPLIASLVSVATVLGLGKFIAKRQIARIDGHDELHNSHKEKFSQHEKELQKLEFKKLDEAVARQMVDSVHFQHNEMRNEFRQEMKEHRKEVKDSFDRLENMIDRVLNKYN